MIEECNFKHKGMHVRIKWDTCSLSIMKIEETSNHIVNIECFGEDNCILYQIYKRDTRPSMDDTICAQCGVKFKDDYQDDYTDELRERLDVYDKKLRKAERLLHE